MRIAVCFSGLIRTGCLASPNLMNFFGELLPNIDFFIHSWDIESNKMVANNTPYHMDLFEVQKNIGEFPILPSKKRKMVEIYNPKKYKIDSHSEFLDFFSTLPTHSRRTHNSMWESIYRSNQLKIEYEREMNIKYDYVVRIRPDLLIEPKHRLRKIIEVLKNSTKDTIAICNFGSYETNLEFVDDVLFVGNSDTMDISLNYGEIEKNHNYDTFITYLNKNNIKCRDSSILQYVILRDIQTHLNPITDFNDIFWEERHYFSGS